MSVARRLPVLFAGWIMLAAILSTICGAAPAYASAPQITGELTVGEVGSSSAVLHATINPGEQPTAYQFEYNESETGETYTVSGTPGQVGGAVASGVVGHLEGLHAETGYQVRLTATNSEGTTQSTVESFDTLPEGLLGLPDGRGYEMVTPPNNAESSLEEPEFTGSEGDEWTAPGIATGTRYPRQAAASGDAIVYAATPGPEGNGNFGVGEGGNEFFARRSAGGGWRVSDLQPDRSRIFSPVYEAFSSELSVGVGETWEELLTPNAPPGYDVLYSTLPGSGVFSPLFTVTPPNRAPGGANEFHTGEGYRFGLMYEGGSSDMSHMLFAANDALTELSARVVPSETQDDLYDSVGEKLFLVNVLPDGEPAPNATFGAPPLPISSTISTYEPGLSNVISGDGSRIFWTDLTTDTLYVRENDTRPQSPLGPEDKCLVPSDACTVQVDASQGPGRGGGGLFWTASSNGSRVFFTDANALTPESTAVPGKEDLYEYDIETGALTDLTIDHNAGESADVRGVLGASEDGSSVYFVANGALAGGVHTQDNLYLVSVGEPPKFIAPVGTGLGQHLVFNGHVLHQDGEWEVPSLGVRTWAVSPDGSHVVFMTRANPTGYESKGDPEVFVYDARLERLWCISCNQSGLSPIQPQGRTAALPVSWDLTYVQRFLADEGKRVFFDSAEALVPQATNGQVDVYEWEQDDAGSCVRPAGCVYLLSSGTDQTDSYFFDASTSGDDAFFSSRAQLTPQDANEAFNLFDARVGAVEAVSPPACTGTGCQGVPGAPPIFATPSSMTFNGVGNFTPTHVKTTTKTKAKVKHKHRKAKKPAGRGRKRSKRAAKRRSAAQGAVRGKAGRR